MRRFFYVTLLFVCGTLHAAQPTVGPLHSIKVTEFLQMPENYQVFYVAGAIDGMTFVSYGYALPDHDALAACYRRQPLGEFTKKVVEMAKSLPSFKENVATLVAKTAGSICRR